MKPFTHSVFALLLLFAAAPASALDSHVIQIFSCEFNDEVVEEEVIDIANRWLEAARSMPGGEKVEVYLRLPVAEGGHAKGDFRMTMTFPNFTAWGQFTDAYEGSAASEVDDEFDEMVDCADSTLWEGIQIK